MPSCATYNFTLVGSGLATLVQQKTTSAHQTMSSQFQSSSIAFPATWNNNMGLRTHNSRNIHSANTSAPASSSQKHESSILKHVERLRASRAPKSVLSQIPSTIFRRPSVPQTQKTSLPTTSNPVSPPVSSSASRVERSVSNHIERLSKARQTKPAPVSRRPSPPASRKVSPTMPAPLSFKSSTAVDLALATQKLEVEELRVPSPGPLVTSHCDNHFEELDITSVMPLGLRTSKQPETTNIQEAPCQPTSVEPAELENIAPVMPLGLKFNKKSEPAVPAPLNFNIDMDAMFSDMDLNLDLNECNATASVMPLALSFKKKTVAIEVEQTIAKLPELTIAPVTQRKSCLRQSGSSKTSPKTVQWKNIRADGQQVHEFKVYIPEDPETFARFEDVDILAPVENPHQSRTFRPVDTQSYQRFMGRDGEYIELRRPAPQPEFLRPGNGAHRCATLSHMGADCCPHCRALANMGGLSERSIANQQTVMCSSCLATPSRRHGYSPALVESGDEDHLDFCLQNHSRHGSRGCDYLMAAFRADARWYCDNFSDPPKWMLTYLG